MSTGMTKVAIIVEEGLRKALEAYKTDYSTRLDGVSHMDVDHMVEYVISFMTDDTF